MPATAGVIGIGMMGRGIAKNLVEQGWELRIKGHVDRSGVEDLLGRGAREAASAREIAESCETVVVCVTASPQVEAVVYGEDGLLSGARSGLTVIDCSTIDPATSKRVHDDLAARGADMADAPLARTPVEAWEGRLNTMVGATDEVFARIRPVLEAFCENIVHVGGPGSGHKIKLLYNFLTMGQAAIIAEALCACAATGIDLKRYHELVSAGGGNSGIFQMIAGKFLETGELDGLRFSLANAEKDLRYFVQMAMEHGLTAGLGKRVHLSLLEGMKLGSEGYVGDLVKAQAKLNNIEIKPA